MKLADCLNEVGEHHFMVPGCVGDMEVVLNVPADCDLQYIAFLGHPHSLQGGTMNNKVVTTLARTFNALGIASVRFNFRGVGRSEGVFDAGVGESEDLLKLVAYVEQTLPNAQCIFAGFSFGSYVAYRAAAQHAHVLLITIAPPVQRFDYDAFSTMPTPWILVQGEADEVVPCSLVQDFIAQKKATLPLLLFSETGHFFHGKLVELKLRLTEVIHEHIKV